MVWVIRLLVAGFALLFVIIGARALLDPQTIIAQFELGRQNATGLSAIRADMGAFFIGTGLAALVGLMPGKREWLLGAAAMVALALTGRVIGLTSDPLTANIAQSMIVEAISVVLLVASFAMLNPRRLAPQPAPLPADENFATDPLDPQRDGDLARPIG